MMRGFLVALFTLALGLSAPAAVLVEDFEADFPAWETGWFGLNSNARNYYGIGAGRGNNPDGLWIQDDSPGDQNIRIVFGNAFALSLTSLSLDVAGYSTGTRLEFFDASGATLSDFLITLTMGALTDPGIYANYGVTSTSGIGGFRLYASSPEGNTSIDNIVASSDALVIPEPSTWLMVAPLLSIALLRGRRSFRCKR